MDEAIFNFEVPDWEYVFFYNRLAEKGTFWFDLSALLIKDGNYKYISRIKFSSGNKISANNHFKSKEDALSFLSQTTLDIAKEIMCNRIGKESITINPGKTGKDLFNEMIRNPDLEITEMVAEQDDH